MSISRNLKAVIAAAALAGAASAAPVLAQDANRQAAPGIRAESPVVVERAPNGRPTAVRVDGVVYKVCMTENEDSCIQPRAAGLGWGDRPLRQWPGRPASQMNNRERAPASPRG